MKRNSALYGAALGATLMYLLDPDRGRYRRALVRDQAASGVHRLADAFEVALRDLRNRSVGVVSELNSWLTAGPAPDEVLVDRIRSNIGRVVSHPKVIGVKVQDGFVTLSGPVLAHEHKAVYRCVLSTRGVRGVDDRLEVHETAEQIPELQGGVPRRRVRPDILQENWAPATRLIAGATGSTLAINALRHASPLTAALGLAGSTLFLRALTNRSLPRRSGVAQGQRTAAIQTPHPETGNIPRATPEQEEALH
ncbi:BON domain-containing protein [Methylocaldum sp.]|uniref:BON domain-containing protein n=1 Tax=Methylocaldum sp. TaxID=1969727 RepID=UPI002D4F546A|nr:BON domain-containing protein [Methylocaldum sp.]HYE36323.1 BON domain-containing protein [Methylocaldum sp.]